MQPGIDGVNVLDIAMEQRHDGFVIRYATDNDDQGSVTVRYPALVVAPAEILPELGLGVAVYLAQLCLARRVRLGFTVDEAAVDAIAPLADMLYEIRRWKDDLPSGPGPTINARAHRNAAPPPAPRQRQSLQLWSGGKDSTLSTMLLGANGYDRAAVHFTVNAGVEPQELAAVTVLSKAAAVNVLRVEVTYPGFLEFSTRYAKNWNRPPLCNTVPFGRDMLLCLLAVPVALATGSQYLSMGHDHECRTAYVEFGGRKVPRNDVESTEGALALESYLTRFVYRGARLLPPVSGLSELCILREMLTRHGDLMRMTSFCFWGDNCGQCAKCLRYYLAQRLLGVDILVFRVNPLGVDGAPELHDILGTGDGVLFQEQVLYCLGRLVESGDVRADEVGLAEFAASEPYQATRSQLDTWERQLMTVHSDPQLPADWSYDLAPTS